MPDLDHLHGRLAALDGFHDIPRSALRPMRVKGIAHDHVRVIGRSAVVRVPKLSQWDLAPAEALAYEAAAFRRAAPSRHTPQLLAVIEPDDALPFGALVVAEISGRAPRLPGDLGAIATALAAIHRLPLPAEGDRAPLAYHRDTVAGTLQRIETQAAFLDRLDIAAAARAAIEDELVWARQFATAMRGLEQPIALVMTDTHPGNFLVGAHGRAVFVDLEKALYGSPAIDLAHATLYTSTTWDPDCARALAFADVAAFYRHYLDLLDRGRRDALRPWCTPMRRLTWLRTITWAAKWLAERRDEATEDSRLRQWVGERFADFFDPGTIDRVRAEWQDGDALAARLGR